MTGAPIRAFVCSREGLDAPDLMLGWIPMLTEPSPRGPRISRQSGLTLYAHAMCPESKGHVHITAADARRPPAINFNFLSSPPDAELTVRAVRIARSIMTAPAMTPFQMSELAPGADRTTDDEILDWVKETAETTYHPVGTCKMGPDPVAVVDAQLRVHGIAGLRVATRWSDADIAATLNRMAMPTGQGKTWTAHRISSVRRVNGIHAYRSADENGEWFTMSAVAATLGVTHHRIRRLIKEGILPLSRSCRALRTRSKPPSCKRVAAAIGRTGRPCRVTPKN